MKAHQLGTPVRKTSRKDIQKKLDAMRAIMNIANGKAMNESTKDISKEEKANEYDKMGKE